MSETVKGTVQFTTLEGTEYTLEGTLHAIAVDHGSIVGGVFDDPQTWTVEISTEDMDEQDVQRAALYSAANMLARIDGGREAVERAIQYAGFHKDERCVGPHERHDVNEEMLPLRRILDAMPENDG